jgi:UDP-N-acetylglucosamine acyltransferase
MAFGDHAELAGLNLIGLKRRGLSRDTINAMRATFRSVFYGSAGGIADRAREAKAQFSGIVEVAEIVDFILAESKQELCLARRRGESA